MKMKQQTLELSYLSKTSTSFLELKLVQNYVEIVLSNWPRITELQLACYVIEYATVLHFPFLIPQ